VRTCLVDDAVWLEAFRDEVEVLRKREEGLAPIRTSGILRVVSNTLSFFLSPLNGPLLHHDCAMS
jgi:hypothetical protein